MNNQKPYHGVFPVAPTTFLDNLSLDLESQKRVFDCMIDQGVDGLCILANYSEQFLLSDDERDTLLDVSLKHIAGRVPVIVTCSHYSTQVVIERAIRSRDQGAAMIMLMPPYHGAILKPDENGIFEHFSQISDQINIPIMIQDAPLSGVHLSSSFLARLAIEVDQISYFKIETPGAANKLEELIALGGDSVVGPFDGEEGITLLADLEAGALGTMPSAMYPEKLKEILQSFFSNDFDDASLKYNKLLPIINFENRQCGLHGTKVVMKEGGVINSDQVRHPLRPISAGARRSILKLAKEFDLVALRWGK